MHKEREHRHADQTRLVQHRSEPRCHFQQTGPRRRGQRPTEGDLRKLRLPSMTQPFENTAIWIIMTS